MHSTVQSRASSNNNPGRIAKTPRWSPLECVCLLARLIIRRERYKEIRVYNLTHDYTTTISYLHVHIIEVFRIDIYFYVPISTIVLTSWREDFLWVTRDENEVIHGKFIKIGDKSDKSQLLFWKNLRWEKNVLVLQKRAVQLARLQSCKLLGRLEVFILPIFRKLKLPDISWNVLVNAGFARKLL